ncbi:PLP-dependent cysteine synthase family protein [Legionella oakridgensis]|uniref:PLP-dependent cysteine synthase family protein n=1 Tax=Legionella oakridgensis TaxID=29423 RepID=UPI0003DE43E2|nr:cysteine synthase family protein [Legionella oakridgensis]ETO92078.1 cysteine synthase [Legionella oakridgensis RV-2-2007]
MKKLHPILDLVGNTPLLSLKKSNFPEHVNIYAKCEMFNPTLSIKDRIVLSMLRDYEKKGRLTPDTTIYEASSGNTGSSLAMFASLFNYKAVITVPKHTSLEKINTIKMYGGTVIVCEGKVPSSSSEHYMNKARILSENHSGSIYFNQYESEENVNTHYQYTGPEIWEQMKGEIDFLIAPASSGGTITGVGKYLKEKNQNIKVILPDPVGSVFYDHWHGNPLKPHPYKVEGAGKDMVCPIHKFDVIDDVIQFTDEEAFDAVKRLAASECIFAGGSSGGALAVAEKISLSFCNAQQKINIVVIFPDSGFKYLSKIDFNHVSLSRI